jgi:ABC-type transporter Mla MlaB component
MLDFKVDQSGEKSTVTINGDLSIGNAVALHGILVSALEDARQIEVTFQNVAEVDLSCLQLLCSAYRTAEAEDKCFCLDGNCPESVVRAVQEAGFSPYSECGSQCEKGCLWPSE